jgi:hypothetical protein
MRIYENFSLNLELPTPFGGTTEFSNLKRVWTVMDVPYNSDFYKIVHHLE